MRVISQNLTETIARYGRRRPTRLSKKRALSAGRILEADDPARVNKRIERLVQGYGQAVPRALPFSRRELALERVIGRIDFLGIHYLDIGALVARSVARLQIRTPGGHLEGYGTGFIVAPGVLLTNHHVLSDVPGARSSLAEFDYQFGPDNRLLNPITVECDPDSLFLTSRELDCTFVALRDPRHLLAGRPWNPLIEEEGKAIVGEYVTIVQHPKGEPKQIAIRENRLVDIFDDFLHYETDTAPGSSGSPIFNDAWEVIGIHHSGVPREDAQGNILMRNGKPWPEGEDADLIDWVANEGIRASRLAKFIRASSLSPAARELLAPMFAPRAWSGSEVEDLGSGRPFAGYGLRGSVSGGEAVWQIPLEVRVRLGGVPTVRTQDGWPTTPPTVTPPHSGPKPGATVAEDRPDLQAALALASEARSRKYFDSAKDKADRDAYYASISPGASPATFYNELSELVTKTHTKVLGYQPSRHVYPWVDLHPDRKLRSVYSGKPYTPEEFIKEDMDVWESRELMREQFFVEGAFSGRDAQETLDLLEASLPYNCEHVVPQSWFDKDQPMRGDLHHLFACESNCNSFRGNTPYFDFPDFEEKIRTGCGRREVGRFEPGFGKGYVARATLYFLLRYPKYINRNAGEYTADRIVTLVSWHDAQKPDEYERHRNQAIFEIQGNRNPLIDHPEWAGAIDFKKGLGSSVGEAIAASMAGEIPSRLLVDAWLAEVRTACDALPPDRVEEMLVSAIGVLATGFALVLGEEGVDAQGLSVIAPWVAAVRETAGREGSSQILNPELRARARELVRGLESGESPSVVVHSLVEESDRHREVSEIGRRFADKFLQDLRHVIYSDSGPYGLLQKGVLTAQHLPAAVVSVILAGRRFSEAMIPLAVYLASLVLQSPRAGREQ